MLVALLAACSPSSDTTRDSTSDPGADTSATPGPPAPIPTMAPSATSADLAPIDHLVAELSREPEWRNGLFRTIQRPATATAEELVADVLAYSSFQAGKVKKYAVLGSKVVRIGTEGVDYVAAVVDTDLGRKVILLQYEKGLSGWWSRVFDASAAPAPVLSPADHAAIDRIVADLSGSRLWKNGHFPKIERPESATLEELVADVLASESRVGDPVKPHKLLGSKTVRISEEFLAAVVETGAGRQVILLRYERNHWWSRTFEAK